MSELPKAREGIGVNDAGLYEVWHCGKMIARVSDQSEAADVYWEARKKTEAEIAKLKDELEQRADYRAEQKFFFQG